MLWTACSYRLSHKSQVQIHSMCPESIIFNQMSLGGCRRVQHICFSIDLMFTLGLQLFWSMTKECKNAVGIHGSRRILCSAESSKIELCVLSRPFISFFKSFGIIVIEESGHIPWLFSILRHFSKEAYFFFL